jgi:hypothetical protein
MTLLATADNILSTRGPLGCWWSACEADLTLKALLRGEKLHTKSTPTLGQCSEMSESAPKGASTPVRPFLIQYGQEFKSVSDLTKERIAADPQLVQDLLHFLVECTQLFFGGVCGNPDGRCF